MIMFREQSGFVNVVSAESFAVSIDSWEEIPGDWIAKIGFEADFGDESRDELWASSFDVMGMGDRRTAPNLFGDGSTGSSSEELFEEFSVKRSH